MTGRGGGSLGALRRRAPWLGVVLLFALLAAGVLAVGVDRTFLETLLATFIGAALGFLVALFIDRRQRVEDAEEQRRRDAAAADQRRALDAEAERRALDRTAAAAKARRITVLTLLRDELGRIPDQMGARQNRPYPPSDRLVDVMWQSLSSSGELRWIEDLELLRLLATAYDFIAVEVRLEQRWLDARALATTGTAPSQQFISNALVALDNEAWRAVCDAYKAVDRALVAEGEAAGPVPFCR